MHIIDTFIKNIKNNEIRLDELYLSFSLENKTEDILISKLFNINKSLNDIYLTWYNLYMSDNDEDVKSDECLQLKIILENHIRNNRESLNIIDFTGYLKKNNINSFIIGMRGFLKYYLDNKNLIYELHSSDFTYKFRPDNFLKNFNNIKYSELIRLSENNELNFHEFLYLIYNLDKIEQTNYLQNTSNDTNSSDNNSILSNLEFSNRKKTKIEYENNIIESPFTNQEAFNICKGIRDKHPLFNKYSNNKVSPKDIYNAHLTALKVLQKYGESMINFTLSLPELQSKADNVKLLFSTLDKRKNHKENPIIRLKYKNNDQIEDIELSFTITNDKRETDKISLFNKSKNIEIAELSREGILTPKVNKDLIPILNYFYTITENDDNLKDAIISYGLKTKKCSICGRLLTNYNSKKKGIGPICEKYI